VKWQRRRRRLFPKKEVYMQKVRFKLVLVVVLSCLTLTIGLVASTGSASANGGSHPHVSRISPRISMKVLSGHFKFHGHYVQRVVLSGVGFDTCDSCANTAAYNGCDGSCNNGCDTCSASCPYYYAASACGTDGGNGYSSCPSNCGSTVGNVGVATDGGNGYPSCSSNCGGANGTLSGSAPCGSYTACGSASSCDCANVQSNLPIYGQDANLSQVPLNAFGEFRVTVLVQVPAYASRANYRMWAINRYNNDCSNILSGSQSW
jgi:hypothetical protein